MLLQRHLRETLLLSQSLGFLINWEKSYLVTTQIPTYLGAVLDIPLQLAHPAEHRFWLFEL